MAHKEWGRSFIDARHQTDLGDKLGEGKKRESGCQHRSHGIASRHDAREVAGIHNQGTGKTHTGNALGGTQRRRGNFQERYFPTGT